MVDYRAGNATPAWLTISSAVLRRLPAGRYRLMNWLCRRPSPPFWARLPRHLGGFQFACDLRDSIAREVCFTHRYEPQETALVRSLLQPGMTFIDVGANWGYFTLLAAGIVGSQGRVISLEPDPRLFALLRANQERNDLDQITPLAVAAADRDDTMALAGFRESDGNWGLSRLTPRLETDCHRVLTRPVDQLLDELEIDQVDLLKMDIEGAEDLALRGMSAGLARGRYRRILLEVHPGLLSEHGSSVRDVAARLARAGYRAWHIDHSPKASRRAAYANAVDVDSFLRPANGLEVADIWPHQLWISPGVESVLP